MTARRIYVPRMSDHAVTFAAAMRQQGLCASVMDPPDAESMAIGLDLCRGRECLPCFLCVGDMVRQTRRPDFDPDGAVFFMPTGPGPCRFGQYRILQRDVLDDLGFPQVQVVSPDAANSYTLLGADPQRFMKMAWQAVVSVDLLLKLLHEHRPYETSPGATDRVYAEGLQRLADAIEAGGGRLAVAALERTAREFGAVPVDRREPRPVIDIVGEVFVMFNAHSNRGLVRQLEAAGAEVLQSTFMDWLHFTSWTRKRRAIEQRAPRAWLAAFLTVHVQESIERRLYDAVSPFLRHHAESPMPRIMAALTPHYPPVLGTEAVLTMARALDYAAGGVSGIVNVYPFSCMPGIVVAAMAPRLRRDFGGLPWLDLSYDGQESTHVWTRLEAFMYQAARHAATPDPAPAR